MPGRITAISFAALPDGTGVRGGWIRTRLAGAAGFVRYVHKPFRVAIGMQSEREYLEERAPDYQIAETVNRLLSEHEDKQQTLVFFSAPLSFEYPFVNGDPETSFEADPERMQTLRQWKAPERKEHWLCCALARAH